MNAQTRNNHKVTYRSPGAKTQAGNKAPVPSSASVKKKSRRKREKTTFTDASSSSKNCWIGGRDLLPFFPLFPAMQDLALKMNRRPHQRRRLLPPHPPPSPIPARLPSVAPPLPSPSPADATERMSERSSSLAFPNHSPPFSLVSPSPAPVDPLHLPATNDKTNERPLRLWSDESQGHLPPLSSSLSGSFAPATVGTAFGKTSSVSVFQESNEGEVNQPSSGSDISSKAGDSLDLIRKSLQQWRKLPREPKKEREKQLLNEFETGVSVRRRFNASNYMSYLSRSCPSSSEARNLNAELMTSAVLKAQCKAELSLRLSATEQSVLHSINILTTAKVITSSSAPSASLSPVASVPSQFTDISLPYYNPLSVGTETAASPIPAVPNTLMPPATLSSSNDRHPPIPEIPPVPPRLELNNENVTPSTPPSCPSDQHTLTPRTPTVSVASSPLTPLAPISPLPPPLLSLDSDTAIPAAPSLKFKGHLHVEEMEAFSEAVAEEALCHQCNKRTSVYMACAFQQECGLTYCRQCIHQ
ncbi:hypothetical protein GYMLUDRAFT_252614 [Collybiopsis luxurians FD-317 M1]|uniref:Uncharacterized protein n=1 Tax=Collybiopsis luxurians FD-317 M1 TaxID=944289 RepID=A0A0D0AKQ8_9AGAR|nr:hypothetical protein GYMLUDRAFT_252614 [Collybiopsis luxurians FD-317 M1]